MHEKENRKTEEGESMKNAPCLNCERRAVGCHSTCEDYLGFKSEHERVAAARLEEINTESIGYKSEGRYKTTLRRQKKKWKKRH